MPWDGVTEGVSVRVFFLKKKKKKKKSLQQVEKRGFEPRFTYTESQSYKAS